MSKKDRNKTEIKTGDVSGNVVNIGGTQNVGDVTINEGLGSSDEKQKPKEEYQEEIKRLLNELNEALKEIPKEHQESAEQIVKRAKVIVDEMESKKPDKAIIQANKNNLEQAAKNIKEALPTVFTIATSIVGWIAKLGF